MLTLVKLIDVVYLVGKGGGGEEVGGCGGGGGALGGAAAPAGAPARTPPVCHGQNKKIY